MKQFYKYIFTLTTLLCITTYAWAGKVKLVVNSSPSNGGYVYANKNDIKTCIEKLELGFSYTDPFVGSLDDNSQEISQLRGANAMSIHTAVEVNYYVEDKEAEENRIWEEIARLENIKAEATAKAAKSKENNTPKTDE